MDKKHRRKPRASTDSGFSSDRPRPERPPEPPTGVEERPGVFRLGVWSSKLEGERQRLGELVRARAESGGEAAQILGGGHLDIHEHSVGVDLDHVTQLWRRGGTEVAAFLMGETDRLGFIVPEDPQAPQRLRDLAWANRPFNPFDDPRLDHWGRMLEEVGDNRWHVPMGGWAQDLWDWLAFIFHIDGDRGTYLTRHLVAACRIANQLREELEAIHYDFAPPYETPSGELRPWKKLFDPAHEFPSDALTDLEQQVRDVLAAFGSPALAAMHAKAFGNTSMQHPDFWKPMPRWRTRDAFQCDIPVRFEWKPETRDALDFISLVITDQALEVRLPEATQIQSQHGPVVVSHLWRRVSFSQLRGQGLPKLLAQAYEELESRFVVCARCQQRCGPGRNSVLKGDAVCDACANPHPTG
jgi:hypothetical protein